MSIVMPALERLGWSPELEREFEVHRDAGLVAARVAQQHRGAYVLLAEEGELWAESSGRLHRDGPQPAVGDWVGYAPTDGDGRVLVHEVLPRRSAFVRRAAGTAVQEQVVAANVDVVFIVTALTERDLKPRRIERYLTLTWESGADPVIVLTKADLCDDVATLVAEIEAVALGVPIHVVSSVTGEGVDGLRRWPAGNRTVALLGSSGVGKSSLVNRLVGAEVLATAEIRDDGRGRHTTTHRELVPLAGGGLVLDTPGMRELQLWDAEEGLGASFADVEALAAECRFNDCGHAGEPGCAVQAGIASGTLPAERLASYEKLQRELEALARKADPRLRSEARKEWRRFARSQRKAVW